MCGIIGLIGSKEAPIEVYRGLLALQHRGQDAAGILSYNPDEKKFCLQKKNGLVSEVFHDHDLEVHKGLMAIGHARYSTVGMGHESELQPLATSYPLGIGMVHNGNIVNYYELVEKLRKHHLYQMLTQNDLEVIQTILAMGLGENLGHRPSEESCRLALKAAVKKVFEEVQGGYSVVGMLAGLGLFAFRDPHGIRPLVLGRREGSDGQIHHCLSSETGPLENLQFKYVRDIRPGELIFINEKNEVFSFTIVQGQPRPCMFEWIYFAGPEGQLEGRDVYGVRVELGRFLAKKIKRQFHLQKRGQEIVVAVPETGRLAALSMAEELGLPYREVLLKNRYIHRSFILNTQAKREKAVGQKLIPVKREIQGKKIFLVDDSIVRGTTAKKIVKLLKESGAEEVTYVSTCPPIRFPCFYGIDFPDRSELVANGKNEQEIAEIIGADQVIYLEIGDLTKSIGIADHPCMACLTGEYPIEGNAGETFEKIRRQHRNQIK